MKAVFDLPLTHRTALHHFITTISPRKVNWVLTGSAGLRLQGVDVPVRDIDIQSDQLGINQILEKFEAKNREGPYSKETSIMRSYFAVIEINNIKVELIGEVQHRQPDGSWGEKVDVRKYRHWITWKGILLPILDLEYEAEAYERLGRLEKVKVIRETLKNIEQ